MSRLHYAPVTASRIIRRGLGTWRLPYRAALGDRANQAQRSPAYLALNPNGLIPALETPEGPIFETGAILLWLTDTHGGIGPQIGDPRRAAWLKWFFHVANTLHPLMQQTFYPHKFVGPDPAHQTALRSFVRARIAESFARLDHEARTGTAFTDTPGALDFYIAACMRWCRIYPDMETGAWLTLEDTPALAAMCARIEGLPACDALLSAEGLEPHPFTAPRWPNPPEGRRLQSCSAGSLI